MKLTLTSIELNPGIQYWIDKGADEITEKIVEPSVGKSTELMAEKLFDPIREAFYSWLSGIWLQIRLDSVEVLQIASIGVMMYCCFCMMFYQKEKIHWYYWGMIAYSVSAMIKAGALR